MIETIQNAIVSSLSNAAASSQSPSNPSASRGTFPTGAAADGTQTSSFVHKILQVALGLFVTTVDLPSLSPDLQSSPTITFDCDFSLPCRWNSVGNTQNRWKLGKGEPDTLLWLASTATMVQPVEPFALLESRDARLGDMLCSDLINCQEGSSLFSFTYWTIGKSDLEICLLDADYNRFNCTGMLQTQVQPGKVALRIPPVEQSFHVAIIPSPAEGILVIDDIKYDARYCHDRHRGILLSTRSLPDSMLSSTQTTVQNSLIQLWSSTTTISHTTANASPITPPPPPPPPLYSSPAPILGPISTASPLPNPFTIGPSLPMGPLILPPLLPGPPAGIVNPFVVAPMIPSTSTFASFTMPSSPQPPSVPPVSASSPVAIIVTAATTTRHHKRIRITTTEEEEEDGEEEEAEMAKLIASMTKSTSTTSTEQPMFTSTIIPQRSRRPPETTATRHTRTPTGIPNININPATTTTVKPLPSFELLIVGNKTRPFFDRRLGKITEQTEDLLCDFGNNFPCLWGAEAGRWAIVVKGAIPSLDNEMAASSNSGEQQENEAPNYPAAVVIQGTAMLSSDPLRCQSGEGKLLFRYWTNGRVLVQVCAMGWAVDSAKIQCVEEVAEHNRMDPSSLAIFELPDPIREPFTLNVVPIWEKNAQNNYLLIDEIAYIGECNLTALNEIDEEEERKMGIGPVIEVPGMGSAHGKRPPPLPAPPTFIPPHFTIRPASRITTTTIPMTTTTTESTTTMTTSTSVVPSVVPTIPFIILPIAPLTLPSTSPAPKTTTTIMPTTTTSSPENPITPTWTPPPPHPSTRRPHPRPRTRRPLVINPITSPAPPPPPEEPIIVATVPPPPHPPSTRRPRPRPRPPSPPNTQRPAPFIEEIPTSSSSSRRPGTRYPFFPSTPTPPIHRPSTTPPWGPSRELPTAPIDWMTTSVKPKPDGSSEEQTIYPGIDPVKKKRPSPDTTKNSFTIPYTTTQRYKPTTAPVELNYCKLLNCDFNENACHYLNHGLTRVPWTLRTKGYGFPLNRNTDLRPTQANGQFVSCVLGPGDFAILESPRFNLTDGINVLLFQYFRPTHSSTIRLCLGTRYTRPLRTVSAFLQCPPILRSVTSKNTPKWNSVHIQLPPGTSHFYLVAHNLDRSAEKTAIAIDNIRVAICDPRATYDPEDPDLAENEPRMIVPSVRRKTEEEVESKELYEDLTEVNEEEGDEEK